MVPDAKDLQSYNRYSYVRNNPLKYVDPSGHFFFIFIIAAFVGALVGAIVGIAISAALITAMGVFWGTVLAAAIGGFVGGLIAGAITGGLKGALLGAAFGFIGGAIGGAAGYGLAQIVGKVGSIAILGGIGASLSAATGGWRGLVTFGAGFAGGLLGSMLGAAVRDAGAGVVGENEAEYGGKNQMKM